MLDITPLVKEVSQEERDEQVLNALRRNDLNIEVRQMINATVREENARLAAVRELKVSGGMMIVAMLAATWIFVEFFRKMEAFITAIS